MMAVMNALFGAGTTKSGRNFLLGTPPETKQLPTMNKGQQQLLSQLLQMLNPQGQLGQGNQEAIDLQRQYLDPSSQAVNQFAQPYMNQFNQEVIPNLAERFAGMGAMGGGLSSSGFGQALGAAGGNLQTQLAALKAGLGQQAGQSLMNQYSNTSGQALGQRPFGYVQQPGTQGFATQALSAYMKGGFPGLGG
jgi:hypothetical protein